MSGGGLGGGLGGILGSILGVALAPETGGLSLALPVLGGLAGGAGGNLLGDAVTGQPVDPLGLALSAGGGALGGLGGGLGGVGGLLGGAGGEAAGGAAGAAAPAITDALGGAGPAFLGGTESLGAGGAATAAGLGGGSAAAAADPFGGAGLASVLGQGGAAGGPLAGNAGLPAAGDALAGGSSAGTLVGGGGADTLGGGGAAGAAGSAPALTGGAATPLDAASFPSTSGIDQTLAQAVGPANYPGATNPGILGGLFDKGGVLSDLAGTLGRNKDLIGPGLLAGSIGKQLLAPSAIPGAAGLNNDASLLRNLGGQFAGASTTGSALTPSEQAAADQTLQGQIAAIKAHYAGLNMSGSSPEKADIADAQNKSLANKAATEATNQQVAISQANTAMSAIGAAGAPTTAIAQQQLADDQALQDAIMMAAAASLYTPQGAAGT